MYSSFHNTSSVLSSSIRNNIFSLLGNSGKTIFSPETQEFSFSFRFFFSKSLRRLTSYIQKVPYRKPLTYLALCFVVLMISPNKMSFAAEITSTPTEQKFIVTAYYSPLPGQNEYYR